MQANKFSNKSKKHNTQIHRDLPEEDLEARNRMDYYDNSYTDEDFGSNARMAPMEDEIPDLPSHDVNYRGVGPKGYVRSDERVQEEICEMLTRHSSIDASDIEVDVRNGEVTLSGQVPERRMRLLAEHVADRCHGVKDIHNKIKVARLDVQPNAQPQARH